MFLSILMQKKNKKQVILVHLRVCETDWKDIHQNVDSDCLLAVEQLIGEFVFLFVSIKIFFNKHGIFKNLVYPPGLTLAIRAFSALENCSWHVLRCFLTPNISNITKHFNFLTMERKWQKLWAHNQDPPLPKHTKVLCDFLNTLAWDRRALIPALKGTGGDNYKPLIKLGGHSSHTLAPGLPSTCLVHFRYAKSICSTVVKKWIFTDRYKPSS